MSFKAIDLQVMVQRSTDISRIKHAQLQQGQTRDHNASAQFKEQAHIQENSVNKLDYTINDTLRDNKNKKGQEGDKKEKRENPKEKENDVAQSLLPKMVGNNFDITI